MRPMETKIEYYKPDKIKKEEWYLNSKLHREDGPAIIEYYKSGKKK